MAVRLTERPAPNESKRNHSVFVALVVVALIVGMVHAASLYYVNDDCFISFRYAKNLINGLGLVYNAGERVEGYTNFLWTMIAALGMKAGFDPVSFSTTIGIIFYSLTIALYGYLSWKFRDFGTRPAFLIPLTALALCLHRQFSAHATSGMETSMFSFLISCTFAVLLLYRSTKHLVIAGILLVLAMMTRPDGVIFLAAVVLYILLTQRQPTKSVMVLLVPVVILFIPYWTWRWSYFGFFFPNAFYAKSIGLSYYSQGLAYAWLYFKTYYVLLLLPVLGGFFIWRAWKQQGAGANFLKRSWDRLRTEPGTSHPFLLATLFIVLYTAFVIRIGGDFIFARFFIAITPMMYFSIELLLRKVRTSSVYVPIVVLVLAATYFRYDQYGNDLFVGYVADESRYFTKEDQIQAETEGAQLRRYFGNYPVRLGFWAGQIRIAYYIDPSYAIECSGGLTDTTVAHEAIIARGRPGHEKQPTLDYLVKRNVDFYIGPVDPPPEGQVVLNVIRFGRFIARIITYDNALMTRLAQFPEIHFTKLPEYLDSYIANIKTYPREKVEADYNYFKSFYFDHNHDERRQQGFLSYLDSTNAAINPTQ